MKTYKVRHPIDEQKRNNLREFSDVLAHLFVSRNIETPEDAAVFISPSYEKGTYSPFLLSDMDKASDRLIKAIEQNENICIFSDYDADGIPGAVIFHDFLKSVGHQKFFNYIPDRQEEGFGLSTLAIDECIKREVTLLITIDCGITDINEVAFARSSGIDVIITDHHLPKESTKQDESTVDTLLLPEAFAVVNPKISPNYPDKMICGAAVAFKLIQAVLAKNRFGLKVGAEKWWLDMVGIATLSDMVPLVNENRVFAYFGLMVLRKSKRLGFKKLCSVLKLNQAKLSEDDITFMITPRINATSRLGYAYDAFRILSTTSEEEAGSLAKHLEKINNERKSISAHLSKEVRKVIEAKYSPYFNNSVIVAGSPSWSPSLLGLVAGNIAEKESKPVFLWGREGVKQNIKGSCRSVEGVSVTKILQAVSPEVLTDFGGHHLAGGFSVAFDNMHLLEEEIERAYKEQIQSFEVPEILVDFSIPIDLVSRSLLSETEKLAPFGAGNPKPLFLLSQVLVTEVSFFGKEKNHLKVMLQSPKRPIEAISFFVHPDIVKKVEQGSVISIVGNLEKNFFGGGVRIRIVDIV